MTGLAKSPWTAKFCAFICIYKPAIWWLEVPNSFCVAKKSSPSADISNTSHSVNDCLGPLISLFTISVSPFLHLFWLSPSNLK